MSLRVGELGQVRVLRDFASVSAELNTAAQVERALLAAPAFAKRYAARSNRLGAASSAAGPGSLAAELRAFQAFYGLVPDFFPLTFLEDASALEFAAWLLAYDHDVYHVLCEYETSDHDEVALQSFLCGQAPAVFGCFVTLLMRASNLDQTRYKHLRDVLDAPLDRQAFVRGRHAVAFVICDFAALAARSLPEVRRMLEIGPRAPRRDSHELQNSCGGKRTRPYFDRSV